MTIKLSELKDLSRKDFQEKVRVGEIDLPKDQVERENLLKFIQAEPGSDYRTNALKLLEPDEEHDEEHPDEGSSHEDSHGPSEPSPKPEEAKGDPWWKAMGYDSVDAVGDKHKALLKRAADLEEKLDRFNAERGGYGRKIKELEEQLKETRKKLKETDSSLDIPKRPAMPKPEDFEDGLADDGYAKAMDEWQNADQKWSEDYASYIEKRTLSKLDERIGEKPSVGGGDDGWNDLWSTEIPALQRDFGLTTTTPIKTIDSKVLVANDSNASEQQRASAKAFLDALPPTDREAYDKISKAVTMRYGYHDGDVFTIRPDQPRYRSWKGTFIDRGVQDEYNLVKNDELTREEEKRLRDETANQENNTATSTPASKAAGGNRSPGPSGNSDDDEVSEFRRLQREWSAAVQQQQMTPRSRAADTWEASENGRRYRLLKDKLFSRSGRR